MQHRQSNPDRGRQDYADRFTRGAFTFRQMEPWQILAMSVVAFAVVIALIGSFAA